MLIDDANAEVERDDGCNEIYCSDDVHVELLHHYKCKQFLTIYIIINYYNINYYYYFCIIHWKARAFSEGVGLQKTAQTSILRAP